MERWTTIFAFAVAGALVASPVLAQTGTTTSPQTGSEQSKPADASKPDAAKPSDSPAAAPKTSGTDASKDATKAGEMKKDAAKDTIKSDKMKSDPMMKSGDKAAGGNREQVKAAQQALKDKGHDPGAIDGVMGPKTQAALKDFQKSQNLKETGRLDAETSAKLGVDTAAAASPRGSQPSASPSGTSPSGSTATPGSKDPSASPGASSPSQSSKDPTTPAKPPQKP